MALIKENDLTEGMSGKFGRKFVFRVVKGVTVAVRRSTHERVVTERQRVQQERFRSAVQYARAKMLDPVAKEEYRIMAGNKAFANAFNAALKDYMLSPEIVGINVSDFTGGVGNTILVSVNGKMKTVRVNVSIYQSDGSLHESGEASFTPGDVDWKYVTKQALASLSGAKVVATAIDRPGNETTEEVVLV